MGMVAAVLASTADNVWHCVAERPALRLRKAVVWFCLAECVMTYSKCGMTGEVPNAAL